MKATHLIEKLQAAVAQHGDMDILEPNDSGGFERIEHAEVEVMADMRPASETGSPDIGRAHWFKGVSPERCFTAFILSAWPLSRDW